MKTQRWVPVLVAVVLGGASFWLAYRYIGGRVATSEADLAKRFALRPVIVAASDLGAGIVLSDEHLASREVPGRHASSAVMEPAQLGELVGRVLAHPVRAGDPLIEALLEPRWQPLSGEVPTGRRAITIPVDDLSSFGGLLEPGNHVDLVYIPERVGLADGPVVASPLLEAVRVIATGQALRKESRGSDAGFAGEPFTTVTLDVSTEAAQRILLAQRTGEITALLRNPSDETPSGIGPLDSRSLRIATAARAAATPRVEIIIGGAQSAGRTSR